MNKQFVVLTRWDGAELLIDPWGVTVIEPVHTGSLVNGFAAPAGSRTRLMVRTEFFFVQESKGQVIREMGYSIREKSHHPLGTEGEDC